MTACAATGPIAVQLLPHGQVISGTSGTICLWQRTEDRSVKKLARSNVVSCPAYCMALHARDNLFLSSFHQLPQALTYDLTTCNQVLEIAVPQGYASEARFLTNNCIALGRSSQSGTAPLVWLFDVRSGRQSGSFGGSSRSHTSSCQSLRSNCDSIVCVADSISNQVIMYDLRTYKALHIFKGYLS
eukprot:TRINITY_DN749_c0_g1_i23.p1 TRINITY_DN749_c0_g1~~TRINITY_DN749_c0_g1_i23.p1  ORF type:complete len:186 (-),score=14.87 TRINITY_DN749_c0_g1_i23:40-597(-)